MEKLQSEVLYESRERDDFRDAYTSEGLRVVQITTDPRRNSQHMYPESHMFTPDSQRFVFHRSRPDDPSRGDYWLCDIANDFALRQLTADAHVRGRVAIDPEGRWMYYVVNRLERGDGLELRRISLETFEDQSVYLLDGMIPGTKYYPASCHGASTISSDGRSLCTYARLDDGATENLYGVLVFNLIEPAVELVFAKEDFRNMHIQYCPSTDPQMKHDLLIQHNHPDHLGVDLHVIRDDGTSFRDIPLGRDGVIDNTGHQQWRGGKGSVISSIKRIEPPSPPDCRCSLIESWPIVTDETTAHHGTQIPGARNNEITRNISEIGFDHFDVDPTGTYLVMRQEDPDAPPRKAGELQFYVGCFERGENAPLRGRYLLRPKTPPYSQAGKGLYHANWPRPFLSPDARRVLFHSVVDGPCHIFMAEGFDYPQQ